MKKLKILFTRIFRRKPKPYLLDNTYSIVPAFEWGGKVYYMHSDPMNMATGRGLALMQAIEELQMGCSVEYLREHCEAVDKLFSDRTKINFPMLSKLNDNLNERIAFPAVLPQHVYKLASIVFFTKEESPYKYDHELNAEKIKAWSEGEGIYNFLCNGELGKLLPMLVPTENAESKLYLAESLDKMHSKDLAKVLKRNVSAV